MGVSVFVSQAWSDGLYAKLTSGPPRADGRCGPFFGNAGCWPSNHCSDYGWCLLIAKNPGAANWTGPFHWAEGPLCSDSTQCEAAAPSGIPPTSMCCDLRHAHFHDHYCAYMYSNENGCVDGGPNYNDGPVATGPGGQTNDLPASASLPGSPPSGQSATGSSHGAPSPTPSPSSHAIPKPTTVPFAAVIIPFVAGLAFL
ncbi:Uncharacterized protein PBTT_01747 [Plasmodiophora brassicae]